MTPRSLWPATALVALALALPLPAAPAGVDAGRLDGLLSALHAQGMAMGSVAVQQGDAAPYLRAIGHARLGGAAALPPTPREPPEAATPATRYRIGSISKLLTAVMALQLADEGALALDDPIARWFPALPGAARISVAQLLQHRSGLGDIQRLPDFETTWMFEPRREAELVQAIASLPRRFEPGERAEYSNSGYLLLGFIVEKAGGQPYGQALQRRLARPLGLRDTGFDARAGLKPQEAASYHWQAAPPDPADRAGTGGPDGHWRLARPADPSVPQGAGGVVSSPRDLVQVIRALFQGRLLQPATFARMRQVRDGFGLGLNPLPGPGPQAWGHEGAIDGFGSVLAYLPEADIALAWCGNAHRLPRDAVVQWMRRALFEPGTRLPSFAPVPAQVTFAVRVQGPASGPLAPATVGVRGDAPPLSWERSLPLALDAARGVWTAPLVLTVRDGVPLEFKYLRDGAQWEHTPNRVQPLAAGEQVQRDDVFNLDDDGMALRREVLAADDRLFEAYHRRDVAGMAAVFSERLEFFHDKGGLSGYAENLRAFEQNFQSRQVVRRERLASDQEVHALGRFGAFHSGSHRFCRAPTYADTGAAAAPPAPGPAAERCETYRFANVWERTPQGLRLLRVVSFDH